MQAGKPLVTGVYLTRGEGERNEWWRYFDGHWWSKGIWSGWVARQWYADRTWPLTEKQREPRRIMYFKEYTQD
jgi:hypothetical protein